MHVAFDELSDDSRIWVFQADRVMSDQEVSSLVGLLENFTNTWAAHGHPLTSSFSIINNCHIIVGVEKGHNQASGCSIDTLVHKIREIGETLGIDFFNRTAIAYEDGNDVRVMPFTNVKNHIENGYIHKDSITFNNSITEKKQLITEWRVTAKDSWFGKKFYKTSTTT